jgi:hypothetical protein
MKAHSAIGHTSEAFHGMHLASSALQTAAPLIDAVSTATSGSASAAKTYEVLIERMKAFNKLVDRIAEVCLVAVSSAACLQRLGPSVCEDGIEFAVGLREGTLPSCSGVSFSVTILPRSSSSKPNETRRLPPS